MSRLEARTGIARRARAPRDAGWRGSFVGAVVLSLSVLAVACSRDTPPDLGDVSHPAVSESTPRPAGSTAAASDEPFRFPEPARLVAIGDVHGDLRAARAALRLAGAIGQGDRWVGGKLVVVQTGDQLDRGDDEQRIVDLFSELAVQAKAAGGEVHALNGNHETMNVLGDFRYVTRGGFADFEEFSSDLPHRLNSVVEREMRGRAAAFLPGGIYARRLAERRVVVIVGDTVFAHGGVTLPTVNYGIARLNRETSAWMEGKRQKPPPPIVDPDGPVWSRRYSSDSAPADCRTLGKALDKLRARRMVVGHTPQKSGITSACGGKVWRIDVGMARHYGGPVEVLEIAGGKVRPITRSTPRSSPRSTGRSGAQAAE